MASVFIWISINKIVQQNSRWFPTTWVSFPARQRGFCLQRPSNCACGHHFGLVLHKKKRLAHAETPSKIGVCPKRHFQRSYDAYFNENDLKNLRRLIIPCWSHCIKWAKSPYTWFARMFYTRDSLPLAHDVVRFSTFKISPHRSAG